MSRTEYMRAYRQRPEVKERERARKRAPEYKARQAEYMRDYKFLNRLRLSGYEQARRAANKKRELISKGEFEFTPYSSMAMFYPEAEREAVIREEQARNERHRQEFERIRGGLTNAEV